MDCPSCGVEMAVLESEDSTLQKCGDCGGLWMDGTELNRLLLHAGLPGLESLGGKMNVDADSGQCGSCMVDLIKVESGDKHHPIAYDTCEGCGGMFLESDFKDASDFKQATEEIVAFFREFASKKIKKAPQASSQPPPKLAR